MKGCMKSRGFLLHRRASTHRFTHKYLQLSTVSRISPVQDAKSKVQNEEDQYFVPDELVDAALPPQQEVPNAIEPAHKGLIYKRYYLLSSIVNPKMEFKTLTSHNFLIPR